MVYHRLMSREDPQMKIRLPADLKDQIEAAAKAAGRSMNAEIVVRLEESLRARTTSPRDLLMPADGGALKSDLDKALAQRSLRDRFKGCVIGKDRLQMDLDRLQYEIEQLSTQPDCIDTQVQSAILRASVANIIHQIRQNDQDLLAIYKEMDKLGTWLDIAFEPDNFYGVLELEARPTKEWPPAWAQKSILNEHKD